MFVMVDSRALFDHHVQPFSGALQAMQEIDSPDELVYVCLHKDVEQLRHSPFSAKHIIICSEEREKLPAILRYVHSNKQIAFISTSPVLKQQDMDALWSKYPEEARSLASRFVFIVYGAEEVSPDLLPYAEFPLEFRLSW